jgi:2-polyprenyl-3-methyl-5-hydroxy-6-metoxy-1,4-benzoquinol methylase
MIQSHQTYFEKYQWASLDFRQEKLIHLLQKYVSIPKGKVLDIGCWNGSFLTLLSPVWEKWGIDIERHHELPAEVHFLRADVEKDLPITENQFDLVFAGEIIEHLLATRLFLERCQRVLKPGGLLILTTPNLSCWLNLWRWYSLGQPNNVSSDEGQDGHVRYLAPNTLRKFLSRTGFIVHEMTSAGGLEFLKGFPWLSKLFFKVFSMRGKHLIAVAQKCYR